MVIWLKYRPHKEQEKTLAVGDVRRCTINSGGEIKSFYAAVMSISSDYVLVKRFYKGDPSATMHLIKEVGPTGLEYPMFVDAEVMKLPILTIGRKMGRVSKTDMRIIKR